MRTIKIFLKKKKPKKASMPVIDTEDFLQKMNLVKKKKKGKRQYARDVYNNLSGENNAKGVNIRMKNIETF